jgi:hypothetical protein
VGERGSIFGPSLPRESALAHVEITLHRLHDGQRRVVDHPARFKVVMCGRRYGKSALGIRWLCDGALAGELCGWFAPNYKYAGDAWRELVSRLAPVTASKNEQERRLELQTGGVIEIWTLDSDDPARGRKYHRVVVDEAGLVADLIALYQASIRPTLVDFAGKALFLGTPKGRRHGFVTLFQRGDGDDPEWQSFRASTLENPYIPVEEVEAARKELPPEIFKQEFEGIPTDDGASPFGLEAIRKCIKPLSTLKPVVFGVDLARSLDYSVVCGVDAYGDVCVLERWQTPWAETKTKIQAMVGDLPIVADSTGVGDGIVADLQGMGVDVTPHYFTQQSKLRLMQRLVAGFQGTTLGIPDGWLVNELEAFEFSYTATGVKYEAPKGYHDDGVMALALALYGWDRVQGAAPEPILLPQSVPDDPNVALSGPTYAMAGSMNQLPGEW